VNSNCIIKSICKTHNLTQSPILVKNTRVRQYFNCLEFQFRLFIIIMIIIIILKFINVLVFLFFLVFFLFFTRAHFLIGLRVVKFIRKYT
jgi:hypothetical protein